MHSTEAAIAVLFFYVAVRDGGVRRHGYGWDCDTASFLSCGHLFVYFILLYFFGLTAQLVTRNTYFEAKNTPSVKKQPLFLLNCI